MMGDCLLGEELLLKAHLLYRGWRVGGDYSELIDWACYLPKIIAL